MNSANGKLNVSLADGRKLRVPLAWFNPLFKATPAQRANFYIRGDGYRIHVTGVTHAENGYPTITPKAQDQLVRRLVDKIRNNIDDISMNEAIDAKRPPAGTTSSVPSMTR